jgi:lipopolysaccharide transport protein LptA
MRITPRFVRRALVAVLLAVSVAVVVSLRRSGSAPASAPRATQAAKGTTLEQALFVRFGEGKAQVTVKARRSAGSEGAAQRLEGVEATLPYVESGQQGTLTVRADSCKYTPEPMKAFFRGNVEVRTDSGLELASDELHYRTAPEQEGWTDAFVRFRRGNVSGTARGARFNPGTGVQLRSEVKLLIGSQSGPPTTIEAGAADVSRAENRIYFDGGVLLRQGNRELRSTRLQLNMVDDFKTLQRAAAIDEVELRIGPGAGAVALGSPEGEKRLHCRRLNVGFTAAGVPDVATAVNPAVLELLPSGSGEKRRIATNQLRFVFDAEGRLSQLDAFAVQPPGPPEQQTTVLTSVSPRPPVERRIECKEVHAAFDPATGAMRSTQFVKDIVFSEPGRKAWAQQAEFQDEPGTLTLSGDPRVVDEAQGSELRAQRITLGTRTHAVSADENVRHTIDRKRSRKAAGPLGSGEEPTLLLCRHFEYDAKAKTARYSENALMRSGRDEIRAPQIVIEEPAEGRRRLTATGGVASLLHPRPQKGQTKEPAVIDARSKELAYDEKERRVVYSGDVEVRQGDIFTKSPEAVVLLTPDGGAVDRMLAGSPVEVRQGTRQAKGDRGTYTPKDDTLVLVGEKVVLQDADRRLEGRILTFQSGSDRIRVDGREEVRTEAVLKRKEPPKP